MGVVKNKKGELKYEHPFGMSDQSAGTVIAGSVAAFGLALLGLAGVKTAQRGLGVLDGWEASTRKAIRRASQMR